MKKFYLELHVILAVCCPGCLSEAIYGEFFWVFALDTRALARKGSEHIENIG